MLRNLSSQLSNIRIFIMFTTSYVCIEKLFSIAKSMSIIWSYLITPSSWSSVELICFFSKNMALLADVLMIKRAWGLRPGHLLRRRREQGRTCLHHAAGKKHTYFPLPPLEWNDLAWHCQEFKKHYLSLLYDWILVLQLLLIGLSRSLYMMARLKHVTSTPSSIIIYMWPVKTILDLTINRCFAMFQMCSYLFKIYS
jgi:hypothetical protein